MKSFRIYILVVLLSCLINLIASAQRGLEFGAYIQPQVHWLLNDQDLNAGDSMQYKLSFSTAVGINAGYNFTDFLGVRSGISYTTLGQDYINKSSDPDTSFGVDLKYLRIPLYLKINTGINSKVSVMIMGGPQLGFLTAAEYLEDGRVEADIVDNYNLIELSASLAAGLQINMDDGSTLNFLWRNEYSLANVEKDVSNRDASRNLSTGIYIAYNYNLSFR
jgi:hypothetical protein